MSPDPLARRSFIGAGSLALASIVTASGVAPIASPATAETAPPGIIAEIKHAERWCRETRQVFNEAVAAFEVALPPPHQDLAIETCRLLGIAFKIEQRRFDGALPLRSINSVGHPDFRFVSTPESLADQLARCCSHDRRRRKALHRMMRRAERREREVIAMEEAFRLHELRIAANNADDHMQKLGEAVFAEPATSANAVQTQACMLCAYSATSGDAIDRVWRRTQAGLWGVMLAASVRDLGATS